MSSWGQEFEKGWAQCRRCTCRQPTSSLNDWGVCKDTQFCDRAVQSIEEAKRGPKAKAVSDVVLPSPDLHYSLRVHDEF